MKTRTLTLLAVLLLFGCTTPQPTTSPITHFRWLDQDWGICASGQPDSQGWLWLSTQKAGQSGQGVGRVNHIIKLNEDSEGSDNMATLSYGYDLDYDPIGPNWQTNPLAHDDLNKYIREVCHLIRPGTLIHCSRGSDRTGCVVYQYRLNCGWPKSAALVELNTNGFAGNLLPGLQYFVDHATPELGVTNTPKAWKAMLRK